MEITVLGFLLGALLLAIPTYMIYALRLHRMRKFLVSVGIMVCMVTAMGGATYLLMRWNSVVLTVVAGLAMAVGGAVLSIRKANLRMGHLLVPTVAGMVVATFIIALYGLFLVLGLRSPWDVRYFVPLFGLLVGGSVGMNVRGLHAYYMGLLHHNQLYLYLLGNGCTHREATGYFVRRAFQAALHPAMRQMAGMATLHAPVLMLALVMGGVGIGTAIAVQMVLFFMVISVSMVSLFVTIWMGRRYSFDEYERLRPVDKRPTAVPQPAPASTISASPSELHHTDAESRLPEE